MVSSHSDCGVVSRRFAYIREICPAPLYGIFHLIDSCRWLRERDVDQKREKTGNEAVVDSVQDRILCIQATRLALASNEYGHRDWSEAKWIEIMVPLVFRTLDTRYEETWEGRETSLYW